VVRVENEDVFFIGGLQKPSAKERAFFQVERSRLLFAEMAKDRLGTSFLIQVSEVMMGELEIDLGLDDEGSFIAWEDRSERVVSLDDRIDRPAKGFSVQLSAEIESDDLVETEG
jgi:hypothetical protein